MGQECIVPKAALKGGRAPDNPRGPDKFLPLHGKSLTRRNTVLKASLSENHAPLLCPKGGLPGLEDIETLLDSDRPGCAEADSATQVTNSCKIL